MTNETAIREEALGWAVRAGDPGFADWDAFVVWLEADPAHARAYDEIAASVAQATRVIGDAAPANDDGFASDIDGRLQTATGTGRASTAGRRRWLGVAASACLALAGAGWIWQANRPDLYTVTAAAGQVRTLALAGDTRIDLAGGSAITLDRKDPRYARLARGQALFTVHHDAGHPFRVDVGDDRLVDIGTVFDVTHDAAGMRVAVAEGAVQFNPQGANLRISPGEMLRRKAGSATYTLGTIDTAQVGEWREGRITFRSAPLDEVAAALTRATGTPFAAAAGSGGRTVSGSLQVEPLRRDPAAIGPLLGVAVRRETNSWVIGSP